MHVAEALMLHVVAFGGVAVLGRIWVDELTDGDALRLHRHAAEGRFARIGIELDLEGTGRGFVTFERTAASRDTCWP